MNPSSRIVDGVLTVVAPGGRALPLIYDSPHSGCDYPADFMTIAALDQLRTAEDAFVDELVSDCVALGVPLLAARFPRSFIDPNRGLREIDPDLLSEPWPGPVDASAKVRAGMGLVRRSILPGVALYADRLSVAEVERRIETYWRPYHRELECLIDTAHGRHGAVWHVDWHSMKSVGNAMNTDAGATRPDFVIGDRDGTTCAPAFTETAASVLRNLGYRVTINAPYKGAELVRRHGRPGDRRHSLQIEINRGLYMDEGRFERAPGFEVVRNDIATLTRRLADFVASSARVA